MILAGTGHRPDKLGGYGKATEDRLFMLAYDVLAEQRPEAVISGMALGWDMALAEAAVIHEIPLWAYVPFPSQPARWAWQARELYDRLLDHAHKIVTCEDDPYESWKMDHRNRRMVDDCHKIAALYNGDLKGGTANCIRYARKQGTEVIELWNRWETHYSVAKLEQLISRTRTGVPSSKRR